MYFHKPRLRRDSICKGCLAVWPLDCSEAPQSDWGGPPGQMRCPVCRYTYLQELRECRWPGAGATERNRKRKRTQVKLYVGHEEYHNGIKCFGWETKLKICSHRHVDAPTFLSWQAKRCASTAVLFGCSDCATAIGRHGRAPTISYTSSNLEYPMKLEWRVPVCTIEPNGAATKESLRQGLRALAERHDDLMCPHMSFADEALMKPFYWDNCMCFREPGSDFRCHINHKKSDVCCACSWGELKNPQDMGKFMPRDVCGELFRCHRYRCRRCGFSYTWTREGLRVYLEGAVDFDERLDMLSPSNPRNKNTWVTHADPATYQWDSTTRHMTWCDDRKCSNSRKGIVERLRLL